MRIFRRDQRGGVAVPAADLQNIRVPENKTEPFEGFQLRLLDIPFTPAHLHGVKFFFAELHGLLLV